MGGSSCLLEAGRVEAAYVVDGPALQRGLREHAPHPGRELVAGPAPADAYERAGDAGYGAEYEIVVGHEVVVALVDVLDLAHRRRSQTGHALVDEARDAVDAGAVGARQIGRVVVADLHRVDESVDDRMAVDAGVEIGDRRHGRRGELIARVGRREEVLGLTRAILA